jgi:hypothetical protein
VIRPLRRAHTYIWFLLALLLPAIFVAPLAVRRTTTPANPNLRWEIYR